MPKVRKGRKSVKRDKSPSPAVSERSTESSRATIEVEILPTKEPEGPDDAEAAEPHVSQEGSIGDTPIPPTQLIHQRNVPKKVSVLFSQMQMRLMFWSGWLATH